MRLRLDGLAQPRVLAFSILLLAVTVALLTPQARDDKSALTSLSAGSTGARGLYRILGQLGWQTSQRLTAIESRLDSRAVYLLLAPPIPVTASETHFLLDAVRAGAGLILVPQRGTALSDSLQLRESRAGRYLIREYSDTSVSCPVLSPFQRATLPLGDGSIAEHVLVATGPTSLRKPVEFVTAVRRSLPGADDDEEGEPGDRRLPVRGLVAVGFPLGKGRVVAIADPGMLRNDVMRLCGSNAPIRAATMVDWAGRGVHTRVVFDEFHHGHGRHPSALRAVHRFLTRSPIGRTLLQGVVAALVLLAALGARPLPPIGSDRVERRSALEHVGALAHAYQQSSAARTATRRLVRGLRRRLREGVVTRGTDEEFLASVADRYPALQPHTERLRKSMAQPGTADDLVAAGNAVTHIETTILSR